MGARDLIAEPSSRYLALQPPVEVSDDLARVMAQLGTPHALPHVTLVAPPEVPSAGAWLDAVDTVARATIPFPLRLGAVASFGERVRYLSVEGEGVNALRVALEVALALTPREQPFVAHLSLAVTRRGTLPAIDLAAIPESVHRPFLVTALGLFARPALAAPYARTRAFAFVGEP